jgi:uroporphyrinogen-III synthase
VTDTPTTILLSRPERQSREFEALLRKRLDPCPPIVVSPILEIVPLPIVANPAPRFLVLTSVHAAAALSRAGSLAGLPAYCVGDRTAEAAQAAGAAAISAGGTAAELVALILDIRPEGPGLYLRGRHAATDIAGEISSAGIETHEEVAYDQEARPLTAPGRALLAGKGTILVPVFSPRSARLLAEQCRDAAAPIRVVAISRAAAEAWGEPRQIAAVAERPDAPAMADAVAKWLS